MSLLPPECPKCGRSHWRHEACPTGTKSKAVKVPKEVHEFPVTIPESVTKDDVPNVPNVPNRSEYQRVKAWKIANREKYNSKMKEVMRRKRAK